MTESDHNQQEEEEEEEEEKYEHEVVSDTSNIDSSASNTQKPADASDNSFFQWKLPVGCALVILTIAALGVIVLAWRAQGDFMAQLATQFLLVCLFPILVGAIIHSIIRYRGHHVERFKRLPHNLQYLGIATGIFYIGFALVILFTSSIIENDWVFVVTAAFPVIVYVVLFILQNYKIRGFKAMGFEVQLSTIDDVINNSPIEFDNLTHINKPTINNIEFLVWEAEKRTGSIKELKSLKVTVYSGESDNQRSTHEALEQVLRRISDLLPHVQYVIFVTPNNKYLGYIRANSYLQPNSLDISQGTIRADWVAEHTDSYRLSSNTNIINAYQRLENSTDNNALPVVDNEGKFVGMVDYRTIAKALIYPPKTQEN